MFGQRLQPRHVRLLRPDQRERHVRHAAARSRRSAPDRPTDAGRRRSRRPAAATRRGRPAAARRCRATLLEALEADAERKQVHVGRGTARRAARSFSEVTKTRSARLNSASSLVTILRASGELARQIVDAVVDRQRADRWRRSDRARAASAGTSRRSAGGSRCARIQRRSARNMK